MIFDYQPIVSHLIRDGEMLLGKTFHIPENEKGIIFGILAWFLEDRPVCGRTNGH